MNERIKELHNRACRLDMEQYPNAIPDGERIQQKFAELIVKKCMDVAKYHTPDTEECEYTWLIHNKIKEHFGVEEWKQ
jgi:hypothetical protein